jgi:NAD(P)-dependent dehydrogenase (short-subunit alcohol dehydrogenase family)
MDLAGRVAVITGASRGLGKAMALALAPSGVRLALVARDVERLSSVAAEARQLGAEAEIFQADIADESQVLQLEQQVRRKLGPADILINNAGINIDRTVRRMTVDEWHSVMRINISGCFYMVKGVIEHMISRKSGRIVNISSIIGQTGNVGQANYATAKSGMFGLSKTLALELAGKGITVNCVAPGFISTDMMASVPEKILDEIVARIPVGRLGAPEEVAFAVMGLLDDRSGYITGAVIPVNGGLDM